MPREPQDEGGAAHGIAKEVYEVGDRVWYLMRDGSREAARVDSVDRTVQPFSYGVVLSTVGSVRETEAIRLRAMTAAEEAAAEAELSKLRNLADEGRCCVPPCEHIKWQRWLVGWKHGGLDHVDMASWHMLHQASLKHQVR